MAKVTKTGNFHTHPGAQPAITYSFTRFVGNTSRKVMGLVYDNKLAKHVVGTQWPAQQGGKHTGIAPDDAHQVDQIYDLFIREFVDAFVSDGQTAKWFELEFAEKEIPGLGMFGADIKGQDFFQVKTVRVGASVALHDNVVWVLINHGPLVG